MTSVTRRRVVKRTYVPAQHIQRLESIARLEMPGLKVGDVPFWKAPTYSNPSVVIATLEQLATMTPAPAINPADVRTEYLDPSDAKQAEEDVAA